MLAIQFDRFGGPDVLRPVELAAPVPGPGEVLLTVEAAGVNFADTHQVDGSYLGADALPYVPGSEVVGRTPDGRMGAGPGLPRVRGAGDRQGVRRPGDPRGPRRRTGPRPHDAGPDRLASAAVGGPAARGETVVVHSAAGGVGSLAVQLAREFGAGRVLAQASTPEKERLALDLGADAVAAYPLAEKADVVLDAVGGDLFDRALGSLASFGRAGDLRQRRPQRLHPGRPGPSRPSQRLRRRLLAASRPRGPGRRQRPPQGALRPRRRGPTRPVTGGSYPLADARRAHEDLLARRTTGKLILTP